MLSVLRVHLPSDIPIVGCELTPYVLLRRPDKTVTTDDVPETAPLDGHFLRYKWYRVHSDKKVAVCSIHPSEQATLQCIGCVKAKIPVSKSYHCTPKCFSDAWQHHRVLHDRAANAVNENGNEEEEVFGRFNSSVSGVTGSNLSASASSASLTNGSAAPLYPAVVTQRSGGETWFEVGRSKTYTPTADDIGHVLKFECAVVDAETKLPVGHVNTLLTSRVIPAPSPTPRRPICVNGMGHLDLDGRMTSSGTFTVLSYNILSEACASNELYNYCPPWALSWPYRRQNLLREIVGYRADIICLQEVQSDHYDEFFAPELDKHGYYGLYKRKTNEVFGGNNNTIDGCATFFRRDRFSHVKKYEVEFNKAAQSLTDAMIPTTQKKTALNRLVKDNVALIVVLEAKVNQPVDNPGKRQLLCVRDTIVDIFYEKHLGQLIEVITASCPANVANASSKTIDPDQGVQNQSGTKPEILLNICELLCFCVLHHPYRIKCNFLLNNVIDKILLLTRRREKYLVVGAVRFVRTILSRHDEHLIHFFVRNDLLKPVIDVFVANGSRYNLLSSAVLELFEYIRKENLKLLLKYIVDSFWDQLVKFEYFVSIHSLKVKYEQCLDNDGTKGTAIMSDLRRRLDERALEKEEEDYFNEDSDDEDSTSTSISRNQKGQQQHVLSNGAAESYSELSRRSGGLVDYDDDDEDYRPPPRKQPDASEEDEGAMESLRIKRKLPSKDKEPELVKKQKLSKSSKSKDSVFAALCSTLSQAVLPGKKTAINIHTGHRTTDGRMTSSEDNQEKETNVSRSCSENSNTTAEENHAERETGAQRNFSDGLYGTTDNGQLGGEDHALVSPKSSPEMAVNGS